MKPDNAEAKFYNAAAIALQSNYESLKKTYAQFGSWAAAWPTIKKAARSGIDADAEWLKLDRHKITLLLRADPEFPAQLREMPWPPFGIYVKGALVDHKKKTIALVGTRKATQHGKTIAKDFARTLANSGLVIVSGLALGIDAAAHEGAVGISAKTVAVIATGLDTIYPKTNEQLAAKILASGGALISEYPIGAPALAHRFIERNRLISALSLGVIIVEAPENSGALATARFALEQNREVFVVPGPVNNLNYFGSHELIKSGAALITSSQDVLRALNLESAAQSAAQSLNLSRLDENQKAVILCLNASGQALPVDAIEKLTNLETSVINGALSFLIIKGLVKEDGGKYYI